MTAASVSLYAKLADVSETDDADQNHGGTHSEAIPPSTSIAIQQNQPVRFIAVLQRG